ncbi:O-antigen ligase family protein [Marinilactibacillus psychrotolerans]|uniref:O-antigen ligase family protein n=1 Tax=Marinilactibacillus psychrotolerans TaxID=191770 RepID=UPI0018682E57|nr:O-antigen ligase family protein [Marinilactibacillus psychrotolerans]
MKKLVYLLVTSVFLGAQILAIDAGIAKVSMYRLILGLTIVAITYFSYQNHPDFSFDFSLKSNQYRIIYLYWLFIAIISIIWAEDFSGWLKGVFFVGCGIFSILLISYFMKSEKDMKILFLILLTMIGLHQLIGWYEILTNNYHWAELSNSKLAQFAGNRSLRDPYSIFTNINDYSTLIFASIPIAFIIFRNFDRLWLKSLSIASIISVVLLLLRTGSRGNQLALITFVFTMVLVKIINRKTIKYVLTGFSVLCIIFIVSYFVIPDLRITVYRLLDKIITGTGSNYYRIHMILNGFIFLFKSLGFGVGSGNVEHWMTNESVFIVDAPNIHNWFMDILVGYGVITFILYIIMYIYILRQLYLSYKYSHNFFIQTTSFYLFAYVISFIFSSISSASNIFIEWQWVLWGIIIAYVQFTERIENEQTLEI